MKLKISILFLFLAFLLVVGILKREMFLGTPKHQTGAEVKIKEFSKIDIFEYLQKTNFISYAGNSLEYDKAIFESADIVTIHFWASWCAPCVNEVPELIDFVKRVSTKNSQNLKTVFLTVSLDETYEELNKFLKSFPEFNKDPFVRIWDKDKSFANLVNADRLPMTIILNKKISEPRTVRGVVEWKSIDF